VIGTPQNGTFVEWATWTNGQPVGEASLHFTVHVDASNNYEVASNPDIFTLCYGVEHGDNGDDETSAAAASTAPPPQCYNLVEAALAAKLPNLRIAFPNTPKQSNSSSDVESGGSSALVNEDTEKSVAVHAWLEEHFVATAVSSAPAEVEGGESANAASVSHDEPRRDTMKRRRKQRNRIGETTTLLTLRPPHPTPATTADTSTDAPPLLFGSVAEYLLARGGNGSESEGLGGGGGSNGGASFRRSDFTVVVQGPLNALSLHAIEAYLKVAAHVVISCWEGDDVSLAEPYLSPPSSLSPSQSHHRFFGDGDKEDTDEEAGSDHGVNTTTATPLPAKNKNIRADKHEPRRQAREQRGEVSLVVQPLPLPFAALSSWELSTLYQFASTLQGLKACKTRFAIKESRFRTLRHRHRSNPWQPSHQPLHQPSHHNHH